MTVTRSAEKRLRLLRDAKKKVAVLARPAVQKRIAADLKQLERRRARLQKMVTDGRLPSGQAKPALKSFDKLSRQLSRALAAGQTVPSRALATIDRDIERAGRVG